jgi:hypothetical protein
MKRIILVILAMFATSAFALDINDHSTTGGNSTVNNRIDNDVRANASAFQAQLQAIIGALRDKVGMGPQQTPGPATSVMGNYRQYVEDTAMRGEQPLSLRDWQNSQMQQQPVSIPR